ncbi:MAG TPA: 2Fe-2S iron-sulfur cluster-binding protein [Vicinamibacteria bacterium]|nr:2Fe-2S iron-sulfur cluster-binding protein [Vicinamibacteria bacterium]
MLARGIRSYHRPTRLEEALDLAARGTTPVAGGTGLFASAREVPNVLDLFALNLARISVQEGDLHIGATATLQDVADWEGTDAATAGLLGTACLAHSASRMLRGMATIGGEAVRAAPDSDVVAALLALNAVFEVARGTERVEIPALRFLKDPAADLAGGGLVVSVSIPGAPHGAALERVALVPSAPSIVSVAVCIAFAGDKIARARIALTGLDGPPARVMEAESRLEGGTLGDEAVARAVEQVRARVHFRSDAHASADYRREVAGVLVRRALKRAVARAHEGPPARPSIRPRAPRPPRPLTAIPYFTSGAMELAVNGTRRRWAVEARDTLMDVLRREGLRGTKHGCETGECGACTVLLDGRPVVSCLTLALRAEGRSVRTVESMGAPDALHPVQEAFVESGAIQCGFCTPAMELCAQALLDAVPDPTEAEIRDSLAGCLCRCTGYVKPVEAVRRAAAALRDAPRG